jgi:hypothetical protein
MATHAQPAAKPEAHPAAAPAGAAEAHDGLRMIMEDHEAIREVIELFRVRDDAAGKLDAVDRLIRAVSAHASAEERCARSVGSRARGSPSRPAAAAADLGRPRARRPTSPPTTKHKVPVPPGHLQAARAQGAAGPQPDGRPGARARAR